jgi:hypothetical protein
MTSSSFMSAYPYTAWKIQDLLGTCQWDVFLLLEECLGGCQFGTDEDMKHTMNDWFCDQQPEFYA